MLNATQQAPGTVLGFYAPPQHHHTLTAHVHSLVVRTGA